MASVGDSNASPPPPTAPLDARLDVPKPAPPVRQIVRGIGAPKGPNEKALEARRARRSEIERLSRLRRSGEFSVMRTEVARLEQLQAALVQQKEQQAGDGARGERKRQYLSVLSEVRRLREQQSRLQNMIHEHALLSISLQGMAEVFVEEEMMTWDCALVTWFDPLSMEDAIRVMRESCEIAATFDRGGPWQSSGGQFMGWRDKRKLKEESSTMIHCFTKQFPGKNAQQIMETTWEMFCQEWFLQKTVVNSSTELNIKLLQVLNDDIRLIKRQTRYLAMPDLSFHTVYMQFRIQIENGFAICLKTVPTPELESSLNENESWVDVFHWITFTFLGDGRGCEVSFGGTINSGVLKFALHWLIESVLAVIRWETVCVAPLFILEPSPSK